MAQYCLINFFFCFCLHLPFLLPFISSYPLSSHHHNLIFQYNLLYYLERMGWGDDGDLHFENSFRHYKTRIGSSSLSAWCVSTYLLLLLHVNISFLLLYILIYYSPRFFCYLFSMFFCFHCHSVFLLWFFKIFLTHPSIHIIDLLLFFIHILFCPSFNLFYFDFLKIFHGIYFHVVVVVSLLVWWEKEMRQGLCSLVLISTWLTLLLLLLLWTETTGVW